MESLSANGGVRSSADGQFNTPQGIAVDSNGYVYVADTYNQRTQKFTSNGEFVTKWGSLGSNPVNFLIQGELQ